MTSTTSTGSRLAAAMHRSLLAHIAALWPQHPLDRDGRMQNLPEGRAFEVVLEPAPSLEPLPRSAVVVARLSSAPEYELLPRAVARLSSAPEYELLPRAVARLSSAPEPEPEPAPQPQPPRVVLLITASPFNRHHEQLWRRTPGAPCIHAAMTRQQPELQVYFCGPRVERRRVAMRREWPAAAAAVAVADELDTQTALMRGVGALMAALLDETTDDTHAFVATLVRQSTPLFEGGHTELVVTTTTTTTAATHFKRGSLLLAELGATTHDTIELDVRLPHDGGRDGLWRRLQRDVTVAEFETLLRTLVVFEFKQGRIAFAAPGTPDELLLLHRVVAAMLRHAAASY